MAYLWCFLVAESESMVGDCLRGLIAKLTAVMIKC